MISTKDRLERTVRVLTVIASRRRETGDPTLGSAIERLIINREMRELEAEILRNPGALETVLARRH